jgi:hypothetical protein
MTQGGILLQGDLKFKRDAHGEHAAKVEVDETSIRKLCTHTVLEFDIHAISAVNPTQKQFKGVCGDEEKVVVLEF